MSEKLKVKDVLTEEQCREMEQVLRNYISPCRKFIYSKERPTNHIYEPELSQRYDAFPQKKALFEYKRETMKKYDTPSFGLKLDLKKEPDLYKNLQSHFDMIYIDPPLNDPNFTWKDLRKLNVPSISDKYGFLFLWVGDDEGLDIGRHLLQEWGYKRVEEITWVKSNKQKQAVPFQFGKRVFKSIKETCLVGLKGDYRREYDYDRIHCNIDTDVILTEEPCPGFPTKPEEIYQIMENLYAGRRRIELFGHDHNRRNGWVTVGIDISMSDYESKEYKNLFFDKNGEPRNFIRYTRDIEKLLDYKIDTK